MLYCFSTSSLILRVHSSFILLNFCLTGFMVGSVGMQYCTISVSILGMSSYDQAKTSLNFVSNATNASFSEVVRVSSFIGSRYPCFNSLLLRFS